MTLVRTGLLNAIAVGVRLLTSLALNKVLAVAVGAPGYAVIGQFQNMVALLTTLTGGALNTGVTKYTAEFHDDEPRQAAYWRTAGTLGLAGSALLGLATVLFQRPLALFLLKSEDFAPVFAWLGFGLVPLTLNALLLAVLNGKKGIRLLVAINISGSLLSLAATSLLSLHWGLYGALVALAVNQSLVLVVTLGLCSRQPWFRPRALMGRLDPVALKALAGFALMTLVSATCAPLSQMLIRHRLGTAFGWPAAGHWEALMRISGLYLMLVTTPLAVYYLPRLSELRDPDAIRREILNGYRLLLPFAVAGAATLYVLREWLILALFTPDFAPMGRLFAWQLVGDTLKIGSWLLSYVMLGKAMVKAFVATELVFSCSWVGLVWLLTAWFGEQGAQMGYCINYALYWAVIAIIVLRKLSLMTTSSNPSDRHDLEPFEPVSK